MANIFTLPRSNSLRFIDAGKLQSVQNYDNRLIVDLYYAKTLPYYWIQQFQTNDLLWFQYRTNYNDILTELIDEAGNRVDLAGSTTLVFTDQSGIEYYNVIVDTSALIGKYRIEINGSSAGRPNFQFFSECFNVSTIVLDSIFIEWFGNDFAYPDQMYWSDFKQGVRVIGRDREFTPEQNKSVYDNSDYAPITLKSKPIRNMLLEINNAPFWMIEKVNIGLSHDEFYVQSVQYNTGDAISQEKLGDLLTAKATIQLTQVDFENGEDKPIDGEIPDSLELFNAAGDLVLFNNTGDFVKVTN